MKVRGSITVMLTFVVTIVMALLLVVMEQAYVACSNTLALQTFDKALESTIGDYYAPLFAKYGLFGVAVGDGLTYKDKEAIESDIKERFNYSFTDYKEEGVNSFLWNLNMDSVELQDMANLMDNNGQIFKEQILEAMKYETINFVASELIGIKDSDYKKLLAVFAGEGSVDENEEPKEGETDGQGDDELSVSFRSVWNTLKSFLKDGFSGWWFEDYSELSEIEVDKSKLPSDLGGVGEDFLFKEPVVSDEDVEGGTYSDKYISQELAEGFSEALKELVTGTAEKCFLVAYTNMKMSNFADKTVNGKLKYEQEYLIFGSGSDEKNITRMGWAIFGIRMLFSLAYIQFDPTVQTKITEFIGGFNLLPGIRTLLRELIVTVWASQNAIVETAAILKGKKVDLVVDRDSLNVQFSEILLMTKENMQKKADNYKSSSKLSASYKVYLDVFIFMVPETKLLYRMMDIIQLDMQKDYGEKFDLGNCYVGYSAVAQASSGGRFVSVPYFKFDNKNWTSYKHNLTLKSAVYITK